MSQSNLVCSLLNRPIGHSQNEVDAGSIALDMIDDPSWIVTPITCKFFDILFKSVQWYLDNIYPLSLISQMKAISYCYDES